MGMIVANRISVERKMLEEAFAIRIEKVCRKILTLHLEKDWLDYGKIIPAIKKDKKQVDDRIRAVLMNQDLSLSIHHDISEDEIRKALNYLNGIMF